MCTRCVFLRRESLFTFVWRLVRITHGSKQWLLPLLLTVPKGSFLSIHVFKGRFPLQDADLAADTGIYYRHWSVDTLCRVVKSWNHVQYLI